MTPRFPNDYHSRIMVNEKQVGIRVPAGTVERAQGLTPLLAARHPAMRVTWTTVMREALLRGLSALEAELQPPKRKGGRRQRGLASRTP